MKKLCLLMGCFLSLQLFAARVSESATFDFLHPTLLPFSTAINVPGDASGDLVNITDNKLVSGPVTISFSNGQGVQGVAINSYTTEATPGVFTYSLAIRMKATMTVSVSNGCELSSIEFLNNSALGDLTLITGATGTFDRTKKVWTAEPNTTSITFTNGTSHTRIYVLKVNYTKPATPLTITSATPSQGATVASFRSMTLQFNTAIAEILNAGGATISGPGITGAKTMSPSSAGGYAIDLSLDEAINKYGDYTVSVAAGMFKNDEGSVNEAFSTSFKVNPVRTTLAYTSVSPAEGTYTALPKDIILTFPVDVSLPAEPMKGKMYKNDASDPTYSVTLTTPVDGDKTKVMLTNSHEADITETGSWRIMIPEGAIHNAFLGDESDDRWNQAFSLSYTVNSPVDAKKAEANALLALNGLGYPAAGSKGRTDLAAEVAKADATEESLDKAMEAFMSETDVTMPVSDRWYQIAGVNKDGAQAWLTFDADGKKVVVSKSTAKPAAFKASVADGKVVFATKDGQFLHILTTLPLYDKTTASNLSAEQSAVNELTLAKFATDQIEGVAAKDLLGFFTLYGSLGKKEGAEEETAAYALLSYAGDGAISTDPGTGLKFESALSSAFILQETSEPSDAAPVVPEAEVTPWQVEKAGDVVELLIKNVDKATLVDATKPYYKDLENNRISFTGNIISPIENEPYCFNVSTTGLAVGTYLLVIPKGTFTYTKAGAEVEDVEFLKNITVKAAGGGDKPDDGGGGGDKPDDGGQTTTVTPAALLSASVVAKAGDALTLTLQNVDAATLLAANKPYYVLNGQVVSFSGSILTATGNATQFAVNTAGLTVGTYTLVCPVGTFAFTKTGQTVQDTELKVSFTVNSDGSTPPPPTDGFNYTYDTFSVLQTLERLEQNINHIADKDLNDLVIFVTVGVPYSGLVPDPTKKVKIVQGTGGTTALGEGHFEAYPDFAKDYPKRAADSNIQAIRLVMDKPIAEGSLENSPGQYRYVIPAGAFGDANFGKYIDAKVSSKPAVGECIANPEITNIGFQVDNQRAAIKRPDTDVLVKAIELAALKGVGYPAENSAARKTLNGLIATTEGDTETYNAAIQAFYQETDVELPAAETWYKVYAQTLGGTRAYLNYDGRKVAVTDDADKATGFLVTRHTDGTLRLTMADGKVLRQLSAPANTTMDYVAADNNVTLGKFALKDVAAEKSFGLFSMQIEKTFAQVNVKDTKVEDATTALTTFTADKTQAFMFEPVADLATIPVPAFTAALSPADGANLERLQTVSVVFSCDKAELAKAELIKLTDQSFTDKAPTSVVRDKNNDNVWVMTFAGVADNQKYRLDVGKGAFTYTFAGKVVEAPQLVATYNVKEPLATAEQKAEVARLLNLTGAGYPAADNAARQTLAALTAEGTAAAYKAAIEAFYAETAVVLPETGQYYKVIAVAADNRQAYLTYDGERLGMTAEAAKATGVKLTRADDGTLRFVTGDGKYLAQLNAVPTTTNDALNAITLARLVVAGVAPAQTLGLFSLQVGQTFAQVDVKNAAVLTPSMTTTAFDAEKTNGFRFEPIANTAIPVPAMTMKFDPVGGTELESYLEHVTVTFTGSQTVTLADEKKIVLECSDGTGTYAPAAIEQTAANVFDLRFQDVPLGKVYTLKIADGAFAFTFAERTVPVAGGNALYSLKNFRPTPEQVAEAERLLALTGVGYPKADSKSRLALESLLNDKTARGEAMASAITDFLYETNVQLPEDGKAYTFAAVGSEGKTLYVRYDGQGIALVDNEEDASAFTARDNGNGSLAFVAPDGKFLTQLTQKSLTHATTETYASQDNAFYVHRFMVSGIDPATTLGCFSLRDAEGVYALVDVSDGSIYTNAKNLLGYFEKDWTNAFRFTLRDESGDGIREITVDSIDGAVYDLTGRQVTELKAGQLYIRNGRKFVEKKR